MKSMFLSDKEVAAILGVSVSTITRAMHGNTKRCGFDLRKAEPITVGTMRRWNISKLAATLEVSPEELLNSIM